MSRVELVLWLVGIAIGIAGLVMGGLVLHRAFADQSQHQVQHSLRHICHQNPAMC